MGLRGGISLYSINDNAIDLAVTPGPSGYACAVKMSPYNPVVRIINQCITSAAGTLRTLKIEKKIDRNIIEISGSLPVGNKGFSGAVTVSRPAELFVALLKDRLAAKGVIVTGQTRATNVKPNGQQVAPSVEIAKLESPPLSLIAQKTLKPSQNMYTKHCCGRLGKMLGLEPRPNVRRHVRELCRQRGARAWRGKEFSHEHRGRPRRHNPTRR
jgi:D-alanyl-D-alanine carboxypeptidase